MPNFNLEQEHNGYIAGIDEVGRGPLAGPVVAAAVIFLTYNVSYVNDLQDSKKLTAKKREQLYLKLTSDKNICYNFAIIDAKEVDQLNIFNATKKAMSNAINRLEIKPNHYLVDGNHKMLNKENVTPVVKGDNISNSIAAASTIAKVIRDKIMRDLAQEYPQYDWHSNSGYGTKAHLNAIEKHGITLHHRKSFAPVKNNLANYKIILPKIA